MTRKMNPDSSWHHRTEQTLGDPGTGVMHCDFTLLQGEGPLHVICGMGGSDRDLILFCDAGRPNVEVNLNYISN